MRKTLFAAVALAPLWVLASSPEVAAKTISSSTSTAQTTATDGDIDIASGVTISPSSAGTAAVTVDSSNTVTNEGAISYTGKNNVVGILLSGGNTGDIENTGAITLSETYSASDTNSDGVDEAPYASSTSTSRYGIELTGSSAYVGDITNTGTISVKGNDSDDILLSAPLTGSVYNSGALTYIGNNGAALVETGGVSGNVFVTGDVTATGTSSNGLKLTGAIGGRLEIEADVTSTGYGTTTRSSTAATLKKIQNTASEVEQGGSAVVVSGSVAGGIFLSGEPTYTNSSDTTSDRDGDGVADYAEATGEIITYGSAPALLIGSTSASSPMTVGGFVATTISGLVTGTENDGWGIVLEGEVEGLGVYDNVNSTAIQIGGLGGATVIDGGLKNSGAIASISYGSAVSTALLIGSEATVPTIENSGTISAELLQGNTTTSTYSAITGSATAIEIASGATVSSLINSGTISSDVTGDANDSVSSAAVVDYSGTLSSVTNTGTISATYTADATGASVTGASVTLANGTTVSGTSIALDLSANTTGVTLTQEQAPTIVVTTTTTSSVPSVAVTTTTASTRTTLVTTATTTTTTTGNVTVETIVPASPEITGDIYLGSGDNTVNLLSGRIIGALSLGSGETSSLTIDNGAYIEGEVSYTGEALTLDVNNGVLDYLAPATIKASTVTVGSSGEVFFGVDPVNNTATELVATTATFAAGSKIGLTVLSNATSSETYTIVSADTLTIAESDKALVGSIPYMFNASIASDISAGTISVTVSPKTAAQMGLNPSQSAALLPTYEALTQDSKVEAYLLDQYTRAGFLKTYNQLMPDYAGGTFQAANAASQAISRATAESNDIENPTGSRGAWAQELIIGVNQGGGLTDGFRGGGFGFVGGVETGGTGLGAIGVTSAFVSTSVVDPNLPSNTQTSMSELEFGTYWQGEIKGVVADARLGAGYTWMAGRREFIETDSSGDIALERKVKSQWGGYTVSSHFGLSYRWLIGDHFLGGGWFIQPQSHIDYFRLSESGYNESQLQWAAMALAVKGRTGQEGSGTASLTFGRKIGTGIVWRPQLELGIRDTFAGDAGSTTARYLSGGSSFTLTPADIQGAAGIARLKLKASSEYYEVGAEAGGEILSSKYEELDMKMSFRVLF